MTPEAALRYESICACGYTASARTPRERTAMMEAHCRYAHSERSPYRFMTAKAKFITVREEGDDDA